jgi:ferredoxin-NADP reductase
MQIIGGVIIGLVVCQLALTLLSSLRRFVSEQRQDRLGLELLQRKVEAAALELKEKEGQRHCWEGFRKFVVARKVDEGKNICSFYLEPHDKKPLPAFRPGQYLTFRLDIPGRPKPVVRCYSLSDSPRPDYYRVTIKKVPAPQDKADCPPGLVSSFFHDHVKEGDLLDVQAPRGQFVLDLTRATPVVLIGGGIGLTPMLCMLNAICSREAARETWLFYGVRNRQEHIMADHLRRLAQEREKFHLRVCYSDPAAEDVRGSDYQIDKRVSVDLLKSELRTSNYEFYVCGPPGMMTAIVKDLQAWGVPEQFIFTEAFGPASVKPAAQGIPAGAAPSGIQVRFARSEKTLAWAPEVGNLLALAQANGIDIPNGCCAGSCGTCETAIKSGEVQYAKKPGWHPQAGSCLVCVATPKATIELDA